MAEVDWISRDLFKVSTSDAIKFLNDEYLEIKDRFPGEFELMANAHALEEKTSNRIFRLGLTLIFHPG